jgi:hypothetical protein|nr:MAG TPA: hypothetical protein [Caudoviricetes sp.]
MEKVTIRDFLEKIDSLDDVFEKNQDVMCDFFVNSLIGCKGQCYTHLYLDLHDGCIFQNVEASSNTWLERDDDSLVEIAADEGWGYDLDDDEIEHLRNGYLSDFGYNEWLNQVAENIQYKAIYEEGELCKN